MRSNAVAISMMRRLKYVERILHLRSITLTSSAVLVVRKSGGNLPSAHFWLQPTVSCSVSDLSINKLHKKICSTTKMSVSVAACMFSHRMFQTFAQDHQYFASCHPSSFLGRIQVDRVLVSANDSRRAPSLLLQNILGRPYPFDTRRRRHSYHGDLEGPYCKAT